MFPIIELQKNYKNFSHNLLLHTIVHEKGTNAKSF